LAVLATAPEPRQLDHFARRLEESLGKPPRAELLAALATVRNFQGRYDDAEQLYRTALTRDPKLGVAINNLAWLLALRGGRADEALALIRQAGDSVANDPGLLDTRAVAYIAQRRASATQLAIADLEQSSAESPTAVVLFHLAQAYQAAGRRQDASQAWRRAVSLGLAANVLHPLERPAFERLAKEFK
jgi:tetratricopeptide (TPR) repeat protein